MLDIESEKFRIRSAPGCGFQLTRKGKGGESCYLATAPSAHRLAMMSERQFDKEAATAMQSGAWQ